MEKSTVPAVTGSNLSTATDGLRWQPPSVVREVTTTTFDSDGVFVGATHWDPVTPTPAAIAAAKRWLIDMAPLLDRARVDSVRQWVIALALQTSGKGMSAGDAEAKAMAYSSTLCDEPGHSFTTGTLKAAARHFKWFPSVAEIIEFLRKEAADRHGQAAAVRRLAESSPVENAEARYRPAFERADPPDAELRRQLSRDRVRRFGKIPDDGNEWKRQMAECAAALGVTSPWAQ